VTTRDAAPRVRAVREVRTGWWEYVVWQAGRWWIGGLISADGYAAAVAEAQRRALVWSTAPKVLL
jgi:hypothetical protein